MAPRGRYRTPQTAGRPDPTPPADNPFRSIPTGRYALLHTGEDRWYFFSVSNPDQGKWMGFTFLKEMQGPNEVRVRGEREKSVLSAILRNPLGSAQDYGRQTGECGKCHTQLTDPKSIALGIGPVCIKRYG
jgi:hypothetical protein